MFNLAFDMNYLKPHQEKPNIALLQVVFKERADFTIETLV